MTNAPAVSVIIPMYNAENFIRECLKSVLEQTLQDYEVVIVNDCSTDLSRQVVASYVKKFGGRLKIFDNEQNLGPGGTRNRGLQVSRGEYIFFLDADDLIAKDALEKMYDAAKKYDADVLNLTSCYLMSNDGKKVTLQPARKIAANEPLLDVDKDWRMINLIRNNFRGAPWRKFTRRTFLLENELFFPEKIRRAEDAMWTHAVWFFAEKIVHIPLAIYFHRKGDPEERGKGSAFSKNANLFDRIKFRAGTIVHAVEWINQIMDRAPFFEANPKYRYPMIKHIAERFFMIILRLTPKISSAKLYDLLRDEFEKNSAAYNPADVLPVLFTLMVEYQKLMLKNLTNDDRDELEKFLTSTKKPKKEKSL